VIALGLVFFSASVNKLPGYVLPLVPAACAVAGFAMARMARRERWLIVPIALLGALPLASVILPEAQAHHLRTAQIPWISGALGVAVAAALGAAIAIWFRSRAFPLAILLAAAAFFALEIEVFPALDKAGSARSLWIASHPVCVPELPRGMAWGLYYYAARVIPDCAMVDNNAAPSR
jgi:4-amino-4-deoxy-L-arabinose transferase-like glycosyltransferase